MVNSQDLAAGGDRPMKARQIDLYERIQGFSLDELDAELPFSQRLANDKGWSLEYTLRVIAEYKKFAFLAVAAGHPVTPSEQIDQVWHLHLTYTRSYWDKFCSEILQTPLHHDPTRGGEAEEQKFEDWYAKTLESYERFFGERPPAEIWSASDNLNGDFPFLRVNVRDNWVLSKLQVRRGLTVSVAILLTLILGNYYVRSSENNINPVGGFLLVGFVVAVVFGCIGFLVGIVDLIKNPSRPRIPMGDGCIGVGSGCSSWGDSGGGCGGCGGGGCGGGGCGSSGG